MPSVLSVDGDASARRSVSRAIKARASLVLATLAALALAAVLGPNHAAAVDHDLARLLRFMALLKGVFAVVALAVCAWRLGRPAALWREAIYVGGPGLMAAGAVCLWNLQSAGLAAAALHLGLFALLAAGLTDEAFIPPLRRRFSSRRRHRIALQTGQAAKASPLQRTRERFRMH